MRRTIAILGLGRMGLATLEILLDRLPDADFAGYDRSAEAVAEAAGKDPRRISARTADIATAPLDFTGVDVVLNLTGPFFAGSARAARAAIAAGSAYLDISDDVSGTEAVLSLHDEAVTAGVPVLTGAGFSPGVTNWLACRLLEENPQADGVQIAWMVHESDPGGLAPLRHMLHMAVTPCPVYRDGTWERSPGFVPATAQTFRFPEPIGAVEVYDTAHPEPFTLVRQFPHLRYASCKGALQPAWANAAFSTLGRIGFGHDDSRVEVNGTGVEPAEFLWKLMWDRHRKRGRRGGEACTAALVQALRGTTVVDSQSIVDDDVMARTTGIGAAVATLVLARHGAPAGAHGAEVLPWRATLPLFEELWTERSGSPQGFVPLPIGSPQ
ncbi:saccharopine dehydrogenase family protein [Amycolatopsis jejuensis]|uniref:saccharopine dehydrogenase family protein n=1 Tax=Amycolatopsis jejuensis TaxID=330084 RepID=UPI00068EF340|nr:saccharopine dehydrogenase NADP-binding domain-containing protein [Amycolatopsis jejuensis]